MLKDESFPWINPLLKIIFPIFKDRRSRSVSTTRTPYYNQNMYNMQHNIPNQPHFHHQNHAQPHPQPTDTSRNSHFMNEHQTVDVVDNSKPANHKTNTDENTTNQKISSNSNLSQSKSIESILNESTAGWCFFLFSLFFFS